jgi:hypothetical protein
LVLENSISVQEGKEMKKIRFCLVLLAVFAIMGGTVFAFDQTDHVKFAPNGEGDLIFFPWYLVAPSGWQTQISVINTSNSFSTVAKVVIRSHNWSDELLDFLIYLSPNDVWTGYVRYGAQGTYIYSDDDSILVSKPVGIMKDTEVATYFASPTNPVSMPLFPVKCPAASKLDSKTDSTDYGYIEVLEVNATTALGTGKLTKEKVFNWYENDSIGGVTVPRIIATANILTGYHEFQNTDAGSYSALIRGQIYADWHNTSFQGTGANTGLVSGSNNTIGELEAAMAKSNVAMPYVWKGSAATLHFFTFPTKLSFGYKDANAVSPLTPCDTYTGTPAAAKTSDYWGVVGGARTPFKCLTYTSTGYDMKENTVTSGPFSGGGTTQRFCEEMQWINAYIPGDLFTEGWIRYAFAVSPTTFRLQSPALLGIFEGAPVLSSAVYIRAASVSEAVASWQQRYVTVPSVAGVAYPYYQYADADAPHGVYVPLFPN